MFNNKLEIVKMLLDYNSEFWELSLILNLINFRNTNKKDHNNEDKKKIEILFLLVFIILNFKLYIR